MKWNGCFIRKCGKQLGILRRIATTHGIGCCCDDFEVSSLLKRQQSKQSTNENVMKKEWKFKQRMNFAQKNFNQQTMQATNSLNQKHFAHSSKTETRKIHNPL